MNKYFIPFRNIPVPIFLAALAGSSSLILSFARGIESTSIPDAGGYIQQALSFTKGISYTFENPDLFTHGIGFSFLMALIFLMTDSTSLLYFKILIALSHGASVFLFYKIGERYINSRRLLISCTLLFTFDPFIILATSDIQTEPITTFLTLFWLYLYLREKDNEKKSWFLVLAFAVSGFYTVIMRPNSLLPFLLIAVLLYRKWIRVKLNSYLLSLSIFVFTSLLAGYEIFISILYSGFVFLTPIGGISSAYMCRKEFIPQYLGIASKSQNDAINVWSKGGGGISEVIISNEGNSISNLDSELYKMGRESCLSNPIESLGVLFLKASALWRPFTVFGAYSLTVFLLSFLVWVPLTIAAIRFVTRKNLTKDGKLLRNFFLVLSIGYTISLLLTPTQIRHRIAFAEPFYWIFFFHYLSQQSAKWIIYKSRGLIFYRQYILRRQN